MVLMRNISLLAMDYSAGQCYQPPSMHRPPLTIRSNRIDARSLLKGGFLNRRHIYVIYALQILVA